MTKVVQPYAVRSLVEDADSYRGNGTRYRVHWLLDVGGPFCLWPKIPRFWQTAPVERLVGSLSNILGLYVRVAQQRESLTFNVVVPEHLLERIRKKVYAKETGRVA